MYETSDIRKGLKFQINGDPYIVVDFQFVKPGKGNAFVRTKIKNMITGSVLEKTYKSGERLERANMEEKDMEYLYPEGENFCFMDQSTYEQVFVPGGVVGDNASLMADNLRVTILFFDERPVGVTLPNFVELQVTETEPGMKGDTATGATKSATLSTGKTVNVPLFVEEGEFLKIDTRDGGSYVERVKKQ